jgi:ligand-binding SRPBCC domain-containing protein
MKTQSKGQRFPDAVYTFGMPGDAAMIGRGDGVEKQPRKQRLSFTTEQWVPFPVGRVFAFFADPMNLPRLMPAWQATRIDSLELQPPRGGDRPHDAGRGSRILLSFRPVPFFPIRLRWLALIDDYVLDHHFCDMQVTGPFGYWRHCHLVKAEARGGADGTRVTDVVDYEWPVGRLSVAMDVLGGRLQLRQIFRYRQRQFLRLLRKEVVALS